MLRVGQVSLVNDRENLKEVGEDFADLQSKRAFWYGPREGWLTFALVLFLLFTVVWSVEAADWVDDLPSVILVAFLGVVAGLAIAKLRHSGLLLLPIGLVLGYLMLIWLTWGLTADEGIVGKTGDLIDRFRIWITAAQEGGISADPLPFVTIIVIVAWFLSFFSSWFVFRSLRLWPVLVPTGFALSLNLLYLPQKFWLYFYLYVLAALLLAMRLYFVRRQLEWRQERVPYFRKAEVSFLGAALVMGSLVVLVAWLLPGTDFSSNFLRKNWAALSSPWKSMETELGRVLTFLPAKKPYTIYKFGEAFPFRGTSSLGDHVAMTIRSSRPAYWRAETFDVYTPKGWLAGDRATLTEEFMPEEGVVTYRAARRVDQVIEMGITSDAVFTGGIPLYSTVGFDLEIAPPMIFTIDLDDPSQDSLLPEDLQPVAESMREEANKGALTFTDEGALRFLPEDTAINEVVRDGNRAVQIELIRLPPNPPDITAMRSHGDIRPSQLYEAISFVSLASEEALQAAGTDYPHWVTDRYLQLPDDLPDRVRGLSMGLTPDRLYDNPYDKAAAIERYLRKIMFYSTDIEPPPEDADGVDYFLFTSMRGYSSYFASAMTVMLRTIGIPARLAVGYSTGDWDEGQNAYVVRSSNAHAWPEAYFPGYGWISFEPVPIQDLFVRGGVIDDDFRIRPRGGPGGQAGGPLPPRASAGGSVPGSSVTSQDRGWLIWVPPVVAGSLLVFAILARYWYNRGLGRLDRPWQVYGKMGRLATLGRLGPKTSYTPREYGEALATEMDVVEGHVEGIAEAYGQSRYGPQGLPREGEELLAKSWRSLRRTLVFWALKRRILFWRSG